MSYTHSNSTITEVPAKLTLGITQAATASSVTSNIVNENDILESIYIYNAAALNMNANTYNVNVFKPDETSFKLADATYDAAWDRLAFTNTDAG